MNGRKKLCQYIEKIEFEKNDASVIEISDVESIGFIDQKPIVTEADVRFSQINKVL